MCCGRLHGRQLSPECRRSAAAGRDDTMAKNLVTSADVTCFYISAGLGNVVIQVVLATNVSIAIGIEAREDVQNIDVDMIARSPYVRRIDERVELIWKDITGLSLSRVEPYAQATIVFWNNILFEGVTTEFVKCDLEGLLRARLVICTAPICLRHREP
ncbi:hypothetical protein GN244_ATG09924 [Phytophthora infestans]|uniref:Uncharacterized protein n=1 Tax=Phytophthora infestans TaxID=4787 RepID=A0A833T2L8_PHYIN|nr:hypothetical protein GN244_ATG09924 [Phytophthora infestans]KAF4137528.1 hypothetical protein GN958_ATG13275 [Phytophthora infestans]